MHPADEDPCPFRAVISTWILINSSQPSASGPTFPPLKNIEGLKFTRWGTVEVDPVTYETGRKGVFAGGDLQTGPWIAIGAIAAGREAAESIIRALNKEDMAKDRTPMANENPAYRPIPENTAPQTRARMPELDLARRKGNFEEVELGLGEGTGKEEAQRCLNCGYCCECFQCVEACGADAVTLETHAWKPERLELEVGSIILSPGFRPFDPTRFDTYNYTKLPNVITSMEFERILSASGPTMGHLVRLSDHRPPKKIAWLQCIGSRDVNQCDNGYCSSACCMYAIKEAVIAKEHATEELDCAIFFMDMRTHGKDFERYYDDAREKQGVRFIRSRVHTLDSVAGKRRGVAQIHGRTGKRHHGTLRPGGALRGIRNRSGRRPSGRNKPGSNLTPGRFCQTGSFHPVATKPKGNLQLRRLYRSQRHSPVRY